MRTRHTMILTAAALAALSAGTLLAQQPPPTAPVVPAGQAPAAGRGGRGPQAPQFVSPEVLSDRRITFRLFAPNAQAVRLLGRRHPRQRRRTARSPRTTKASGN